MLAGVACAALTALSVPATAATNSELPTAVDYDPAVDQAVSAFYASRSGAPLWFRNGPDSGAARELMGDLLRAPLDGMPNGPAMAAQAQVLLGRATAGDTQALASADRLLSTAWVDYVQVLQTPPSG